MKSEVLGCARPDAMFEKKMSRAWESFRINGECERHLVRNVILTSWERCRNINPGAVLAPVVTHGEDDLARLRNECRDLCMAAKEVTGTLAEVLNSSESLLMIANPLGVILDVYGSNKTLEFGQRQQIAPGANWEEKAGGTNAIGTAIAAGCPIQVHACEHFYETVHTWSCSGAPIRDPIDRRIVGVLDISSVDESFNMHSLALAISAANQIEALLSGWEAQGRIRLLQWCNEEASSSNNDGLIILDKKGRIVSVNKYASHSLKRFGLYPKLDTGTLLGGDQRSHFSEHSLSSWVREEWIQRASRNGEELGTLLVIPHRETLTEVTAGARHGKTQLPTAESVNVCAFDKIIGQSEAIRVACTKGRKLGSGDFPVIILGETGVGKEQFANAMHNVSAVSSGPFVAINCGTLSKDLAASELFGYADGAFTGGRRGGRAGKFEEANGGTLFLDEIGELPIDVQVHLLRVLQDGFITRIGENRPRKLEVRLLSATHCDLRANIANGQFRQDLYYRLSTTILNIPPLRARQMDVGILAEYFMEQLYKKYGKQKKILRADLIEVLNCYPWPGNVRELKNLLESMWHLSDNIVLVPADLPDEYCHIGQDQGQGRSEGSFVGLERAEYEAIVDAFAMNGNNVLKVSRHLGIARSTLYDKIRKYGIKAA